MDARIARFLTRFLYHYDLVLSAQLGLVGESLLTKGHGRGKNLFGDK